MLPSSKYDYPEIYEETDSDLDYEIPFCYANLPQIPPAQSESALEKSLPTSEADFSAIPGHVRDYTAYKGDFSMEDVMAINFQTPLKHTMWDEACGELRRFGSFAHLALDIQITILEMCDAKSLLRITETCPSGEIIGQQDRLWKKLYCAEFEETDSPPLPDRSWMRNYRESYHYLTSATILGGVGLGSWKYAKNHLFLMQSPQQRWIWNPVTNLVILPSKRLALWDPETQVLQVGLMRYNYNISNNRILQTGSFINCTITRDNGFPPKSRVILLGPSVSLVYHITGTVPIPLIIALVFNIL